MVVVFSNFMSLLSQGLLSLESKSTILPGGLLHDIPEEIVVQYPELPDLLKECVDPISSGGRYEAVEKLMSILFKVMVDVQ